MNRRIILWLLKCYPSQWRAEYGLELEDILCRRRLNPQTVRNVLWSAFRENLRQPLRRFFMLSLLIVGGIFLLSFLCSSPLWRFISAPVGQVLQDQGVQPPRLIAVRPLEQLGVVWVGIPVLATALASYPCLLFLASMVFAKKRPLKSFAIWSAALFTLTFLSSSLAWQHGALTGLLQLVPDTENAPGVSISHCFTLLAASTLGTPLVLQIPLAAFYVWRVRTARS